MTWALRDQQAPLLAALAVVAAMGCGSEPPTVPLCDGTDGLTLRVFYEVLRTLEPPAGVVRVENGYPSFAVDGQCRYYMSGGWQGVMGRDQGWRQGNLDAGLRRSLERLGASELSDDCGSEHVNDAARLVVATALGAVGCLSQLNGELAAVVDLIRRQSPQLWMRANALDQGLHVVAAPPPDVETPRWYPWPDGLALQDYFDPDSDSFTFSPQGRSKIVSAADAAPLRASREAFLSDLARVAMQKLDGIPVTDGEGFARVFMRDALPYEDDRGLWPLPGE